MTLYKLSITSFKSVCAVFKSQFINCFANLYTKTDFISSQVYVTILVPRDRAPFWSAPRIATSDLWPSATAEVRDSRTSRHSVHAQSQVWQILLVLVSISCVYKSIQNRNVVGPGQRSRFLVPTNRSAMSQGTRDMRAHLCIQLFARQSWKTTAHVISSRGKTGDDKVKP